MLRIGLVMLQGARHAHVAALQQAADSSRVEIEVFELRTQQDLAQCDCHAYVLPGGESTTMRWIGDAEGNGLLPALYRRLRNNSDLPVLATCAGAILLADPQDGGEPLVPATVNRNAYGRQFDSFQSAVEVGEFGEPFPGVFIRAPRFESANSQNIVAEHQGEVVGVRQGNRIALTFHPELSPDRRFHEWLITTAQEVSV